MDIAAEIRAAQGRKGMTIDALAGALGMDRKTVARKTKGISPITWEDIQAFAVALDTTPSMLVADAENQAALRGEEAEKAAS